MDSGFQKIENVMQHRRQQCESVKGKTTNFRVMFRYGSGSTSYQYFERYEDCLEAWDRRCTYGPWGNAIIQIPSSKQIQIKGPRGGWRKYKP